MDLSPLDNLPNAKVLVVGDVMVDKYLWGVSNRISPEAPVPVYEQRATNLALGGAGNVVSNLVALGCHVGIGSVIGSGASGKWVRDKLIALGVDISSLVLANKRPTTIKTRVMAQNQQLMRIDREERQDITPEEEHILLRTMEDNLTSYGVIVLSDYGKGVLTDGVIKRLISQARLLSVPVLGDPKGSNYLRYAGVTLLTPNRKEAAQAVGFELRVERDLAAAGEKLLELTGGEAILITLSKDGMVLFIREKPYLLIPTRARLVYDITGAGDTVVATLAAVLASGGNLLAAAEIANMAGGVVVGKVGTAEATPEEIRAFARRGKNHPSLQKIVTNEEAATVAAQLRAAGKTIVFTNGFFDQLNVGHIRLLQHARTLGDCLILGLNSDASLRRLKGNQQTVINEKDRAQVLAALSCIDFITIFEDEKPLSLIGAIRPQVLVKGDDYTLNEVVGRDIVEAYGGRVELLPVGDGPSTTTRSKESAGFSYAGSR